MDALGTPSSRDGNGRTHRASTAGDPFPGVAGRVHPRAQLPDDPETIVGRDETVARFRAFVSPQERAIFDEPFSDPERMVARRVGTTPKTVHSARNRIRKKARLWGARASVDVPLRRGVAGCAWPSRPWPVDEGVKRLIRPMTPDEIEDERAGYAASRYRARRAPTTATLTEVAA